MNKKNLCIILLLFFNAAASGQQKNFFEYYKIEWNNSLKDSVITFNDMFFKDTYHISNKGGLFYYLPDHVKYRDSVGGVVKRSLFFERSVFEGSARMDYPYIYDFENVKFNNRCIFRQCTFTKNNLLENLKTADSYDPFLFFSNTAELLNLANINGAISFTENTVQSQIGIFDSKLKYFSAVNNRFITDSSRIQITGSQIESVFVSDHNKKYTGYHFDYDTVTGKFVIMGEAKPADGEMAPLGIVFSNCHIDFNLISFYKNREIFFAFRKCSFGKNFNISGAQINSLILDSCISFEKTLDLNSISSDETVLSIGNTDLSKLNLNYNGKLKLLFTDNMPRDYIVGTYENLLAKFKLEGKLESYKNLDIDYKEYNYSNGGFWGTVKGIIDNMWWHYGYKKYYIIYWTLLFLFVFFIYNVLHWEELQLTYPILKSADANKSNTEYYHKSVWGSIMKVFIFTCVIFFSLKIDLTLLSYKHMKVVKWFFIQYLVGLICVFFLANAILKL